MKRRSLDALFSLGFGVAATLLVALGFIMSGHATAIDGQIRHQLEAQRIAFPQRDQLTSDELARPCLAANAGKWVLTAAQAECYADDLLGTRIEALVERGTNEDVVFRGDQQRGLLLTTQSFDEISSRSRDLGNIFYVAAGLLALLAMASVMHRALVAEGDTLAADGGDQRRPTGISSARGKDSLQRRLLQRRPRIGHSASR